MNSRSECFTWFGLGWMGCGVGGRSIDFGARANDGNDGNW